MKRFLSNLLGGALGALLVVALAGPLVSPSEAAYVPNLTGAILYRDASTATGCWTGWAEVTGARGAVISGLVNGSANKGVLVGTALTDGENRVHTHTITASGVIDITNGASAATMIGATTSGDTFGWKRSDANFRWVSAGSAGVSFDNQAFGAATHSHGGATVANATTSTVPYVQYLVCKKN